MADNTEGQEKTEDPTAKRLRQARNRGQVAKSTEMTTAAVLLIGGGLVFILGGNTFGTVMAFMKETFIHSSSISVNTDNVTSFYGKLLVMLGGIMLPIMLSLFLVSLASEISQVGLNLASEKFTKGLNFKSIFNPLKGVRRIFFSSRSMFELGKSFAKLVILGLVVYSVIANKEEEMIGMMERPFVDFSSFIVSLSIEMVMKVAAVYLIIAFADWAYQKYKYKEDLKMTKFEVREETKQSEGDPKVKARMRQLIRQRFRSIMMRSIESADVVITNPTHFAVCLKYKMGEMNAPVVVAKGVDFLAFRIREKAIEFDIPIVEEPPLARTLYYGVQINEEIPENLFKAVAQVLAYVYNLKEKRQKSYFY